MNVKLISITQALIKTKEGDRYLTASELISYAARVSNPSNQLNVETASKLLAYCLKHKHFSIFEQASFGVEIQTSRAIAAQILRHKSFSFQEYSQRYSLATEIEEVELRAPAEKNRQSSEKIIEDLNLKQFVQQELRRASLNYNYLIENGVSKETARMILPLATSTTLYMTGTVRSWIHYLELRCAPDTQKEHRLVALAVKDIFIENFPDIAKALEWTV